MYIRLKDFDDVVKFVRIASIYNGDIDIISGHTMIDGKSLLGLMSLDLNKVMEARLIGDYDENVVIMLSAFSKDISRQDCSSRLGMYNLVKSGQENNYREKI